MELTRQSMQEVFGGLHDQGAEVIYHLMKKCIAENKKIVWYNRKDRIDGTEYRLIKIKSRAKAD